MVASALFSSATEEWATPDALWLALDAEFGFTMDVCATAENARCVRHFTKAEDGLAQEWRGTCWMNPPYGRSIGAWVRKAAESATNGARLVCLLPARTDTRWWHAHIWDEARHRPRRLVEIRFVRGRVRFSGSKINAPFPNVVVVFHPHAVSDAPAQ